jgi:hypothetical protein
VCRKLKVMKDQGEWRFVRRKWKCVPIGDHDGKRSVGGVKTGADGRMRCSCFTYRSNEDVAAINSEWVSRERGFWVGL